MAETVTLSRPKRSTAGNRMRELLEKAHQEDEDDIFAEVEGDEDFQAPDDVRDVFLDEFADTDDEVEVDEEEAERELRREERRKAKGKGKAYNPLAPKPAKQVRIADDLPSASGSASSPFAPSTAAPQVLLDPSIDPASMAPSTLVLALRKQRREQKRMGRSEARRSTMRASTLKTEEEIIAREKQDKERVKRMGRKALHEGGEVRGVRPMTQDELIAAALEEEEKNAEALRDWLRKEEQKRELRRVGRKRVRGPRWTWISRTVGKVVEVVRDDEGKEARVVREVEEEVKAVNEDTPKPEELNRPIMSEDVEAPSAPDPAPSVEAPPQPASSDLNDNAEAGPSRQPDQPGATVTSVPSEDTRYTRNYLILSQIPGGLPAELKIVLGDHVEWDEVQYIPSRNRPINRRVTICPITGQIAKYRHPASNIPYASAAAYKQIEAVLAQRYIWSADASCWLGGEEDVFAEGLEDVPEWRDAMHGGWMGGRAVQKTERQVESATKDEAGEVEAERSRGKRKALEMPAESSRRAAKHRTKKR